MCFSWVRCWLSLLRFSTDMRAHLRSTLVKYRRLDMRWYTIIRRCSTSGEVQDKRTSDIVRMLWEGSTKKKNIQPSKTWVVFYIISWYQHTNTRNETQTASDVLGGRTVCYTQLKTLRTSFEMCLHIIGISETEPHKFNMLQFHIYFLCHAVAYWENNCFTWMYPLRNIIFKANKKCF